DLTGAMYAYHNNLTAPHAASSPWWAWLFDFKPVWFYQQGLAGNTTAAIYDAGNLVVWWLGLPALGFAAWQAFARRSLPLALITPNSAACPPFIPQFVLTTDTLATAVVVGVSVLIVVRLLGRLQVQDAYEEAWSRRDLATGTRDPAAWPGPMSPTTRTMLLLLATAIGAIVLTALIRASLVDTNVLVWDRIPVE